LVSFLLRFTFIMPRVPRKLIIRAGDDFHTMWRCHNKSHLLRDHADKRAYLQAVRNDYLDNCSREEFAIHSYTMMANHGHLRHSLKVHAKVFSNHLRRAHGRFGLGYNRRHGRIGPVAAGRPTTVCLGGTEDAIRCDLYIMCNPVRAGIVRHPTDILWKDFSCCRYFAYGEKNYYDDMLELPQWYLDLGRTDSERQHKFRSMLDRYLVETGFKRDPRLSTGYFFGPDEWVEERRKRMREMIKKKSTGPPAEVTGPV